MQVNSSNGTLQNRYFSGTGSIGGIHLPDFNDKYVFSKKKSGIRLDRDVPVLMTNFPSILNRLTGVFAEDRAAFIASLDDYSLLVIDDLGVERNTEYAMEQMFTVIDSRYRSKRPLIVTTNLKLEEIKNPPDLAHARIYDRILERCAPVLFSGKNFREEGARATKAAAKDAPALVKKIGRTTYIVRVHFSKTSRETMSDKIKRMLRNEIQQM